MSKIDVHGHIVPPVFREALEAAGGDPAGWHIPYVLHHPPLRGAESSSWTPQEAIAAQDKLDVRTSVLSVTSPGCLFLDKEGNRKLARQCNDYAAQVRKENPGRFGFLVNIPNPRQDMQGCLDELARGLDELDADGVCLLTQYDGHYLGHPDFRPLWQELHRRKTTVLIHPTPPEGYQPMPAQKYCPCPLFEFPHETTRTVSDLVMSGTRTECSDVNIILCHGGGTIPILAHRIALLSAAPALKNPLSSEEIIRLFQTFYYDTALSGVGSAFDAVVGFVPEKHLVIGSDHPYAVPKAMLDFARAVEARSWSEEHRRLLYTDNARDLFPRLLGKN